MLSTIVTSTALLLSCIFFAIAIDSIDAPSSIHAGTDFQVSVSNDLGATDSLDASFEDYRIYLSIVSPASAHGCSSGEPICYLVNSTALSITNVTVKIPTSVGPSGEIIHW
ncbi:hypothetical protein N431DRAFT_442988 [Stipitochalara longipes BDJ]|nr:hypothetical protein N431DRAFT_442988 [Stipitochalara longipes BDJ]